MGGSQMDKSGKINNLIGLASLVIGIVAIIASIIIPELRCMFRLDKCQSPPITGPETHSSGTPMLSSASPESTSLSASQQPVPSQEPSLRPADQLNPEILMSIYSVSAPIGLESDGKNSAVSITPDSILNLGNPVVLSIEGERFTSHGFVRISVERANGGTVYAGGNYADNSGSVTEHIIWTPDSDLDIQSNNGNLAITVEDGESGTSFFHTIQVKSGPQTPSPDQWTTREEWLQSQVPASPPTVSLVALSGSICSPEGQVVQVTGSGFTPDASVTLSFTSPTNPNFELMGQGRSADPFGNLPTEQSYWISTDCPANGVATLRVEAWGESGGYDSAEIDLHANSF